MGDRSVLIVDDEEPFLDLCRNWLADEYEVHTANGGEAALEGLTEETDVVLLDRRMPGLSGDAVLEEIRRRGVDCRVVMVTAVKPRLDVVDWAFDDYLVKPVSKDDIEGAVEQMLARATYTDAIQRYFALASKVATLRENQGRTGLESSDEFEALEERLDAAMEVADDAVVGLFERDSVPPADGERAAFEGNEE